ncbi:60 kDa chaperonin [Planctomycetes bacterium CA13]|uniref:Chaperonin GroEL n=1 Tax=Novipirellula herctigrandis TaxID=2527986 RepID=A0A5C5YX52_9BACT|nr:60 kDa chaperonin [Planctomycetes bacterium CA13]
MSKLIAFDNDVFEALRRGVTTLSKAVKATLGPRGKNVIIRSGFGGPSITKDGVTVAKAIELEDPLEDAGAQMVRQVASRTNDVAGDGTTTATVLAEAIFNEGLRAVVAGVRPVYMKQGIEEAVEDIVAYLKTISVPVKDNLQIERVATIAANNNEKVGKHVAEALDKVGKDGVVTLDDGKSTETEIEWVEGMQFDRGYLSPYFINDTEKMECVLEEPLILIFEKKISVIKHLLPVLEKANQAGRPLLIIAEDVDGDALATLVVNRLRGTLKVAAVKAPGYGDRRKEMLEDIAILTGGQAIFESLGVNLDAVKLSDLGMAQKVLIDKDSCTLIKGGGDSQKIKSRVAQLRTQREKTTSDYDREKLDERIAKLAGGVAKINVGAMTETEVKERRFMYEDAINAAKAASEEGIVPGGGVALLRASLAVGREGLHEDEQVGYKIVLRACRWPLTCIVENAGQDGSLVCEKVAERQGNMGYNAMTDTYEDLMETGIIDPTKVVRSEIQNAASVAALLLTSDVLIVEKPEEKEEKMPAGMGMY